MTEKLIISIIRFFLIFLSLFCLVKKIGRMENNLWLLERVASFASIPSNNFKAHSPPRSVGPVYHENTQKSILLLNWEEFHKEKQMMVVQNQYRGDNGYGEEPFGGEQSYLFDFMSNYYICLIKCLFFLDCQFSNCYITNNSDYFGVGQTKIFDAIVFGMPHDMSDEVSNEPSINYVASKSVIFNPLPPYSLFFTNGVY